MNETEVPKCMRTDCQLRESAIIDLKLANNLYREAAEGLKRKLEIALKYIDWFSVLPGCEKLAKQALEEIAK